MKLIQNYYNAIRNNETYENSSHFICRRANNCIFPTVSFSDLISTSVQCISSLPQSPLKQLVKLSGHANELFPK